MITVRQRNAEKAGFGYEKVRLKCGPGPKQWMCPQMSQPLSVEKAALSHFAQQGWRGFSGEGGLLLTLIKAMSFQNLGYDERTRYVEALYTLAQNHPTDDPTPLPSCSRIWPAQPPVKWRLTLTKWRLGVHT
ncbi:TPA: hypothetical protein UMZ03_000812 [Stenotrophomonas maltophilia]|nr:hypothetical protein [Stenotrophomonas maltophilia]